jgi:cold shock CspA family protein
MKSVPDGKNFGFIFGEDDKEYFFHITNLADGITLEMLKPGVRVRFPSCDIPADLSVETSIHQRSQGSS